MMSDNPVDQYPGQVSFDVRVTCPPRYLARVIEYLESPSAQRAFDYDVSYPPGDGLPYEHTLPGMEKVAELFGA